MTRLSWLLIAAATVVLGACSSASEPEVSTAAPEAVGEVEAEPAPVGSTAEAEPSGSTPVETPEPRDLPTEDPDPATEAGAEAETAALTYPAGDEASLEAMLNPLVAEFGVEFTRGALVERGVGIYEPSTTGNHLALYVAPLDPFTDEQFVVNFWEIAAVVTPYVFDSFSGVQSYDICQEPYSEGPREGIPPPVTQIDIDRVSSDAIDWSDGSLADLFEELQNPEGELSIRVDPELQQVPTFVAALADAGL